MAKYSSSLLININDLLLLQGVEKQRVEFKKAWHGKREGGTYWQVMHTVCAFANDFYNDNGGYIIIGVEEKENWEDSTEDRQIILPPLGVPCRDLERIQKEIMGACRANITPEYFPILSPEVVESGRVRKHVLVIWAMASDSRPHRCKESEKGDHRFYIRRATETRKATREEEHQLLSLHSKIPFDDRRALDSECSSSDDPSEEENHDMETRCSCGKNRRHTDVPEACVSNRCPCYKLERPCSRKCRCYNCKNKNDSKPNGINNKITNKGCKCGLAKKNKASDASNKSCRDGVRKSRCPCVASATGCSELCRCVNCGNIFQARVATESTSNPRKRQRQLVSPYKRKTGRSFMSAENVQVESGRWRNLEMLCLMVCREVLFGHGVCVNARNLQMLFNFVAQSDSVKDMSLLIDYKSIAQVAAKIAHLEANHTL